MHYHARDMAVVRARDDARSRSCSPRRRRRSKPRSMRGAAAIGGCICRSASAASICPRSRRSTCARRPAARTLHRAAARRGGEDRARARRAGAAVPQPPRLCAADALPRLRLPLRLPELRCLAGRSPLPAPARLPSLRLRHAAAGRLPEMPGDGQLRRRAAPASSGWRRRRPSCFPTARMLVLSSDLVDVDRAHARGTRRRRRRAASTSSSARSSSPRATIFPSSTWSASSMPISASPTAIRAPPSARSSCCIRWSAAPGARKAAASAICRRTSPSIR